MTLLIIMSWIIYKESISHFHRIRKSSYSYPGLLFKQSQLLCGWWVCDSPEGWGSVYIYKINASEPRGLGFPTGSHQCPQVPWGAQSLPVALWEMLGAPRCAGGAGAFELGVLTTWAEPIPCVRRWQKMWKHKFSVHLNMVFKVFPCLINQLFRSSITKCFLAAKQLGKKMNCLSCKNYFWRWNLIPNLMPIPVMKWKGFYWPQGVLCQATASGDVGARMIPGHAPVHDQYWWLLQTWKTSQQWNSVWPFRGWWLVARLSLCPGVM